MGSKNDDVDVYMSSSYDVCEGGATRKTVSYWCVTESRYPTTFVRRCEKHEQTLKDVLGRPTELVGYTQEYTEKDVSTDQMIKSLDLPAAHGSYFKPAEKVDYSYNFGNGKSETDVPPKDAHVSEL